MVLLYFIRGEHKHLSANELSTGQVNLIIGYKSYTVSSCTYFVSAILYICIYTYSERSNFRSQEDRYRDKFFRYRIHKHTHTQKYLIRELVSDTFWTSSIVAQVMGRWDILGFAYFSYRRTEILHAPRSAPAETAGQETFNKIRGPPKRCWTWLTYSGSESEPCRRRAHSHGNLHDCRIEFGILYPARRSHRPRRQPPPRSALNFAICNLHFRSLYCDVTIAQIYEYLPFDMYRYISPPSVRWAKFHQCLFQPSRSLSRQIHSPKVTFVSRNTSLHLSWPSRECYKEVHSHLLFPLFLTRIL